MKKLISSFLIILLFSANAIAGSDGENELSKKNKNKVVKDCFEPLNRATFALNMGIDKVIFKPVAKAYRVLPSPIRTGTSNGLRQYFKFNYYSK